MGMGLTPFPRLLRFWKFRWLYYREIKPAFQRGLPLTKRNPGRAKIREGAGLPPPAMGAASSAPTVRPRVTYQTGIGGSVTVEPPNTDTDTDTAEPEAEKADHDSRER